MYTLGYASGRGAAKAIADGPSIRATCATRPRSRHRRADPLRHQRRHALAGRAPTPAGRSTAEHRDGRDHALTCGFLFTCSGYYRYDQGFTPELPGIDRFAGPDRPPAALARGPRLRRQAGRRHRQRRDRGDARAGAGRARPRTSTMLQRSPSYVLAVPAEDPIAQRPAQVLPDALAYRRVRWKNVVLAIASLPAQPPAARRCARSSLERGAPSSSGRTTTSTRTSRRVQPLGPAPVPGARRRPLHARSARATRRSSPTHRDLHRDGVRLLAPASELDGRHRRHGHRPEPAGLRRHRLHGRRPRVDLRETMAYKGLMLSGVPNFAFTSATRTRRGR